MQSERGLFQSARAALTRERLVSNDGAFCQAQIEPPRIDVSVQQAKNRAQCFATSDVRDVAETDNVDLAAPIPGNAGSTSTRFLSIRRAQNSTHLCPDSSTQPDHSILPVLSRLLPSSAPPTLDKRKTNRANRSGAGKIASAACPSSRLINNLAQTNETLFSSKRLIYVHHRLFNSARG